MKRIMSIESLCEEFIENLRGLIRVEVEAEVAAKVEHAIKSVAGAHGAHSANGHANGESIKRRSPEELAGLTAQLRTYIGKNPDQRVEQIALGLKVPTKALVLPLRTLLKSREIKAKGVARGTTYRT